MIENIDYQQNEWVVLYMDEMGNMQALPMDTYDMGIEFLNNLEAPKIGIVTSLFYNAYICKEED